jgi:hypothetical protein
MIRHKLGFTTVIYVVQIPHEHHDSRAFIVDMEMVVALVRLVLLHFEQRYFETVFSELSDNKITSVTQVLKDAFR